LQARVLVDPEKHFHSSAVRAFFKLVFFGRGFDLSETQPKHFKSPYSNAITEEGLLIAYVRGAIRRLGALRPVTKAQSVALSKVLFGNHFEEKQALIAKL